VGGYKTIREALRTRPWASGEAADGPNPAIWADFDFFTPSEGVEMARRVTYGDESHEWSDMDGEYLANSGVTFA
jgi:hypothetical protein